MGAKIRFLGGYQDGTRPVSTAATTEQSGNTLANVYVQGQPLRINNVGDLELCNCYREGYDDGYAGLAKGWSGSVATGDKLSDIYNGNATYWAGFNQYRLDSDDVRNSGNDVVPFDDTPVYNPGDDIFINTLGFLTNVGSSGPAGYTSVCANATPIAYVLEVGTNNSYLIINQVR